MQVAAKRQRTDPEASLLADVVARKLRRATPSHKDDPSTSEDLQRFAAQLGSASLQQDEGMIIKPTLHSHWCRSWSPGCDLSSHKPGSALFVLSTITASCCTGRPALTPDMRSALKQAAGQLQVCTHPGSLAIFGTGPLIACTPASAGASR